MKVDNLMRLLTLHIIIIICMKITGRSFTTVDGNSAEHHVQRDRIENFQHDPYESNNVILQQGYNNQNPYEESPCAHLNQVQSTVIQLLSTQYEYGQGIHTLHGIVAGIQHDMKKLQDKMKDITELSKQSSNAVTKQDVNNTFIKMKPQKDKIFYNEYDYNKDQEIKLYLQDSVKNLTRMFNNHFNRYSKLNNRVTVLKKVTNKIQTTLKDWTTGKHFEELETMSYFMKKQTDLNGSILNRLRWLENNIDTKDQTAHNDQMKTITKDTGCPEGFLRYAMSCYLFTNVSLNWIQAEKQCQEYHPKSHLVGIETEEEQDFIVMYRKYNDAPWTSSWIWTGGNDMTINGEWTWIGTNKPLKFTNWRKGKPDNLDEDHHCIYFGPGIENRWDDWHCYAARLNSVCEISL